MIRHKIWIVVGKGKDYGKTWTMEGWYLFGFIPLYIRTRNLRY